MSLKLGTTNIAGIPTNLINTVNKLNSDYTTLNNKVDNKNETWIRNSIAPDYSKATSISLQYGQVLGFNGWLSINLGATGANQGGGVYINNVLVASFASGSTSGIPDNTTSVVMVTSNDVITWNANGGIGFSKIPFKGV